MKKTSEGVERKNHFFFEICIFVLLAMMGSFLLLRNSNNATSVLLRCVAVLSRGQGGSEGSKSSSAALSSAFDLRQNKRGVASRSFFDDDGGDGQDWRRDGGARGCERGSSDGVRHDQGDGEGVGDRRGAAGEQERREERGVEEGGGSVEFFESFCVGEYQKKKRSFANTTETFF